MRSRTGIVSVFALSGCLAFAAVTQGSQEPSKKEPVPAYRNSSLSTEDRVADLLPRLTLEEKVEQISGGGGGQVEIIDPTGTFTTQTAREALGRWWDPDLVFPARRAAILRNAVQRYLHEKSRLHIPMIFLGEALHGYMAYGSTSFPQALGLASTWDPDLVQQVFDVAGDESAPAGIGQAFTPVLDLARDSAGDEPKRRTAKIRTWVPHGVAAVTACRETIFGSTPIT